MASRVACLGRRLLFLGRRRFAAEPRPGEKVEEARQADKDRAVVLSQRLPEDFVENTLLPHLESQLLYNVHIYTPAELTQIAKAYCKQEVLESEGLFIRAKVRQLALCRKLADTMPLADVSSAWNEEIFA